MQMDKKLRVEFYKLFDEGISLFNKIPPYRLDALRGLLLSTLSRSDKEEYLCESIMIESVDLFNYLESSLSSPTLVHLSNVGDAITAIIAVKLTNKLMDLFEDALLDYNINNTLNDHSNHRNFSDRDFDILCDNRDRL
jgi:hypothetical protein